MSDSWYSGTLSDPMTSYMHFASRGGRFECVDCPGCAACKVSLHEFLVRLIEENLSEVDNDIRVKGEDDVSGEASLLYAENFERMGRHCIVPEGGQPVGKAGCCQEG
jgi:hypothetical protein